jgi:hypothetical protein
MGVEVVIPHAIREVTESEFKSRGLRARHRAQVMKDSEVFAVLYADGERRFVVGQEVVQTGGAVRLVGAEKYVQGYFDVYMLAMLSKLCASGHENIVLSIAHPPDAIPQVEKMLQTLVGKHRIIRDGQEISYKISAAFPWDEPAGGIVRALTHPYAAYNANDLNVYDKVLIVDIGGKVSSITPAILGRGNEVETLFDDGTTFELGIQDVQGRLDMELRSLHPNVFKGNVPPTTIEEVLRGRGAAKIQGTTQHFDEAVALATNAILDQIEKIYVTKMRRALDARHVFLTGGGSGLLEKQLNEIFEHGCSLADSSREINLANLRGGAYAFEQFLQVARERELKKLFGKSVTPRVFVLDLGNSFGKGMELNVT